MDRIRLSNVKDKDLLEYEIVRGNANPKYYEQLAKNVGFKDLMKATNTAIKSDNTEALMAMGKANVYAVTSQLVSADYSAFFVTKQKEGEGDHFIPQLFFMIRAQSPPRFKNLMKNLTRSIILKTSLNIAGRGYRGKSRHRVRYYPGLSEFDLDETVHNYFQRGKILTINDIIGIERRQIRKNIVLILDTSGSMYGELLLNAALTTSVLSYAMSKDFTSVVLFSSEAYLLKSLEEERPATKLIDQILDSEAVGYTNISKGLAKGLAEIKRIKNRNTRKSFAILITDGEYNRGQDPAHIARLFPRLHVIGMPSEKPKGPVDTGQQNCARIAKAGHGHYLPVKKYSEIPRALMKLLGQL